MDPIDGKPGSGSPTSISSFVVPLEKSRRKREKEKKKAYHIEWNLDWETVLGPVVLVFSPRRHRRPSSGKSYLILPFVEEEGRRKPINLLPV